MPVPKSRTPSTRNTRSRSSGPVSLHRPTPGQILANNCAVITTQWVLDRRAVICPLQSILPKFRLLMRITWTSRRPMSLRWRMRQLRSAQRLATRRTSQTWTPSLPTAKSRLSHALTKSPKSVSSNSSTRPRTNQVQTLTSRLNLSHSSPLLNNRCKRPTPVLSTPIKHLR